MVRVVIEIRWVLYVVVRRVEVLVQVIEFALLVV